MKVPSQPSGAVAEADGPEDRLRRFVTIWSRAIFPVTATSLTRAEFEGHLLPLARTLCDALHARPFDTAPAQRTGTALVAAHCTDPDALGRSLGVVDSYLVLYCGTESDLPAEELRARCARLQHAMAAGYAQALRERTRAEQEAIARSALAARSAAEIALHATESRFRAVFDGAAIGIGIADLDGNVLEVNETLTRMFGGMEGQVRSRNVSEWVHPEDGPHVWKLYEELVRGEREHYRVEKPYYRGDGTVLWTNLTVSLLRDADGNPQYQLALMEDTTERRLLHLRLRYEATHDALTGLPNRTLFFERLEKALAPGENARFGLCYLDLDGFKVINDSLGHSTGDRLLVEVADRLQSCVTGAGEMVARLGGDEFVALTTGAAGQRDVTELADRILAALATPSASTAANSPCAAASESSRARRGSAPRPRCSAAPTSPCTGPSRRAATASNSPTRRPTPAPSPGTDSPRPSPPPWSAASSSSSTSRSSTSTTAACTAPRPSSGGATRSTACSARTASSRSPRTPASSCRSAAGCSRRPCARPASGRPGTPTAARCGSTSTSPRHSSTTRAWSPTPSTSWNGRGSNRARCASRSPSRR